MPTSNPQRCRERPRKADTSTSSGPRRRGGGEQLRASAAVSFACVNVRRSHARLPPTEGVSVSEDQVHTNTCQHTLTYRGDTHTSTSLPLPPSAFPPFPSLSPLRLSPPHHVFQAPAKPLPPGRFYVVDITRLKDFTPIHRLFAKSFNFTFTR